ncbi:MAG: response regulator [Bacteroidota bacterium]
MRRRVLLIDDEKVAMQFYIKALRESGYEVIQVCDPDEAVEYMENSDERTPDIIILDIMLPPGNRFRGRPDVEEGLRTGVLLYPELHYRTLY